MGADAMLSLYCQTLVSLDVECHLTGLDPLLPQRLRVQVGDFRLRVWQMGAIELEAEPSSR